MPHLSPMSWIYFLSILWFCMLIMITNMWWLKMKPMNPMIKNNTNNKNMLVWKW
uniref:ATP synthase F0 subunit 8 n=1 Tax=Theromyzon tessulatum TaxID=13286 RepID=A0A7L7S515_THETS|nr:ATP synthase F0 subunit 8 [Theromyzon tessulatum]QNV11852.1 ATP synthase F0 subunit 8 [Theromyzon tessulatum]UZT67735.1 ATP synthase F0 subunit 8 [Theromyzon tessulatum]